jgi:two-component system, cell cycle response regulator
MMNGRKVKVLIIDDSPVTRKLIELPLLDKGYNVVFAPNDRGALEVLDKERPDVIITDWVMRDFTGKELCRYIRSSLHQSYTYILVLTSQTRKDGVVEALASGADDYLTKPFHRGELLARVGVGARIIGLQRQIETENKQLEELALTDVLTGLPNRRAIESWATNQLSSAVRHDFAFWVVLADLDYFKRVNDTFGHDAGDTILKKFSEILKRCTRRGDLCGRIGGEEFLLVLTHTSRENALTVIDRIRGELSDTSFSFSGCTIGITASFGLAGFEANERGSTFSKLRAEADAALYSAKRRGRNRVVMTPAVAY